VFEQDQRSKKKHLDDFQAREEELSPIPSGLGALHSQGALLGFCLILLSVGGCTFSASNSQPLAKAEAEIIVKTTASPVVNVPTVEWTDLVNVCQGQAAIAAQAYEPTLAPSTRGVVFVHRDISQDDRFHLYDSHIFTRTWQPTNPEHAELVVCISENKRFELLETCAYKSGRHTLNRYRNTIDVELRAAQTGEAIATTTLSSDAILCPATKPIGDEREWNWSGQLPDAKLYGWLKPYLDQVSTEDRPYRDRLAQPTVATPSALTANWH
jgi:hypothetical protein